MDMRNLKIIIGPAEPVPPSRFVKIVMSPMTKVLNPLIVRLAGRHPPVLSAARQLARVSRWPA